MSVEQDRARYMAAAHAVQSAIALDITRRHGIDVDSTLGRFLKGVITGDEYVKAMADAMEREKAMYEAEINVEHPDGPEIGFA